jgi:hypothetical protein
MRPAIGVLVGVRESGVASLAKHTTTTNSIMDCRNRTKPITNDCARQFVDTICDETDHSEVIVPCEKGGWCVMWTPWTRLRTFCLFFVHIATNHRLR